MLHTRAKIVLETPKMAQDFVKTLNSDGSVDKYMLEDFDASRVVDARSILGVIYASAEFEDMYLVNMTEDGKFPFSIDQYRA